MKTLILNITAFLFSLLLGFDHAAAHRVNLFAWVEGDTVYVESKLSGGQKVNAGKIIVTDPQGIELVKGTTNEKGEFSFKIPKKTDLKIVLLSGKGHRAEWVIPVREIEMPAAEKKPIQEKSPTVKDILIGIGCIFGLVVITLIFKNRKKKTKVSV
jgi:nickel transport protein